MRIHPSKNQHILSDLAIVEFHLYPRHPNTGLSRSPRYLPRPGRTAFKPDHWTDEYYSDVLKQLVTELVRPTKEGTANVDGSAGPGPANTNLQGDNNTFPPGADTSRGDRDFLLQSSGGHHARGGTVFHTTIWDDPYGWE